MTPTQADSSGFPTFSNEGFPTGLTIPRSNIYISKIGGPARTPFAGVT